MSAWHLLWIIPLSAFFGFMLAAIFTVGARGEYELKNKKGD